MNGVFSGTLSLYDVECQRCSLEILDSEDNLHFERQFGVRRQSYLESNFSSSPRQTLLNRQQFLVSSLFLHAAPASPKRFTCSPVFPKMTKTTWVWCRDHQNINKAGSDPARSLPTHIWDGFDRGVLIVVSYKTADGVNKIRLNY